MTRQQFVEAWRHEICGMILDSATADVRGAGLSILMRGLLRKVDTILGQQYDELTKPEAHTNGITKPRSTV